MYLLLVYVGLVIVGDVIAYFIGLAIERMAPGASLLSFLGIYFLFLYLAWVIAVRITRPRTEAQPQ